MIRHVVLIRLRPDVPNDVAGKLIDRLRALPAVIPEIRFYQAGADLVHGANSMDVALIADFDNLDALQRYRVHPAHVAVLEESIKPYLGEIRAVDFAWSAHDR